jgi:hypothetical protein
MAAWHRAVMDGSTIVPGSKTHTTSVTTPGGSTPIESMVTLLRSAALNHGMSWIFRSVARSALRPRCRGAPRLRMMTS